MENSRSRVNEHLGVNKMGRNIKKSPLHQPNFGSSNSNNPNTAVASANTRPQPQPQVYNISKNDFRNIVQQLTGSPSQDPLPRPPNNQPKSPSMRLQRIRPPPLRPMNRPSHMYPSMSAPVPNYVPSSAPVPGQVPYSNNGFVRPGQFGQPQHNPMPPVTAESPISAYMRYLQNSIGDSGPGQPQAQPQFLPPGQPHLQPPRQTQMQPQSQPQLQMQARGQFQSQPFPSSGLLPSPPMPPLPSPRTNGPALLPSPTSQFLLPSPNGYPPYALSPRSPYPLLSPGFQYPQPPTPNFPFSPMGQSGLLGPGPQPFPPSPGIVFPVSPSGFFPSPRWRDP